MIKKAIERKNFYAGLDTGKSRLYRHDSVTESRLPFQGRLDWGQEAGGMDSGGERA